MDHTGDGSCTLEEVKRSTAEKSKTTKNNTLLSGEQGSPSLEDGAVRPRKHLTGPVMKIIESDPETDRKGDQDDIDKISQ